MLESKRITLLGLILTVSLVGSVPAVCPVGDVSGNCEVNLQDMDLLAQRWLDPTCVKPDCKADLDDVPGVGMGDFAVLAQHWGEAQRQITLVINEFMSKNDGSFLDERGDADDWIEIYNYGGDAVNIGGMYITDKLGMPTKGPIPNDNPFVTTIASGGYLVIWADGESDEGTLHVDFAISTGEDIGLFDSKENLIDSFSPIPELVADTSSGCLPDANDTNWMVFDTPSPGGPNRGTPIEVLINEIMYHPYHDQNEYSYEPEDMNEEYIELYNDGAEPVNLDGWRFIEGVEFAFPNVTIGVGQYLVVASSVNKFTAKYPGVSNVVGGWAGRLSNSGEDIELVDNRGVLIDRVEYADQGEWAVRELGPVDFFHRGWVWSDGHDGEGKSLELINPAVSNEYGQNWAASGSSVGTPGVVNSAAAGDIAPVILDVKHFPAIPGPGDPVTVTARIIDEQANGITVTLHYRVDVSVFEDRDTFPHHDPNVHGRHRVLWMEHPSRW